MELFEVQNFDDVLDMIRNNTDFLSEYKKQLGDYKPDINLGDS